MHGHSRIEGSTRERREAGNRGGRAFLALVMCLLREAFENLRPDVGLSLAVGEFVFGICASCGRVVRSCVRHAARESRAQCSGGPW